VFRLPCRSLSANRYVLQFGMDRSVCLNGYKTPYLAYLRDLRLFSPVSVGGYGVPECDAV